MKQKRVLIGLLCWVLCCCVGCQSLNGWQKQSATERGYVFKNSEKLLLSGKAAVGEHYFMIANVGDMPSVIPSRYVVEVHYEMPFQFLEDAQEEEETVSKSSMDSFSFVVYALATGEKLRTIDVKAILEREYPDQQIPFLKMLPVNYQGEPCMMFFLEDRSDSFADGLTDTLKKAYLNVETEQLYVERCPREQWRQEANSVSPQVMELTAFTDRNYDLFELNGISGVSAGYNQYWQGLGWIHLPVTSLPEENERLYDMFPQLKQQAEKAKQQEWENEEQIPAVWIGVMDFPTAEDVIALVLPDGQQISFEGMYISEYRSIDEEEHEIHSFEEYRQYYQLTYPIMEQALIAPIFPSEP